MKYSKQMIKDTVWYPLHMDSGSILVLSILGGGFALGVWFILIRRDAALEVRQGMVADGLRAPVQGSSFSSARSEFERKLMMIESERRRRNLSGGVSVSLIPQEQQPVEPVQQMVIEEPPSREEPPVEEEDDDEESEEEMLERRRQRDEE